MYILYKNDSHIACEVFLTNWNTWFGNTDNAVIWKEIWDFVPGFGYVTDSLAMVVGYNVLSAQTVLSYRERNPLDTPPGPGFAALWRSKAYIPMKPHQISRSTVTNGFQVILNPGSYPTKFHWSFPINSDPNLSQFYFQGSGFGEFSYALHQRAIYNLYGSLLKRRQVNGGVLLAELKDSFNTLGKAVLTLAEIIRALKKGRVTEALRLIKAYGGRSSNRRLVDRAEINRRAKQQGKKPISSSDYAANAWLETQFGWLPIINDIYDIILYIVNAMKDPSASQWMSFSGYAEGEYTGIASHPTLSNSVPTYWDNTIEGSTKLKVSYTATFELSDEAIDFLNSIGLLNPASILWEVAPLSFVGDWFLPVGNFVESLTATAGMRFIECCSAEKSQSTYKLVYHPKHSLGLPPPLPIVMSKERFSRVIIPDDDLPPFPLIRSRLADIFQPWKFITSVALIKSLFGKH